MDAWYQPEEPSHLERLILIEPTGTLLFGESPVSAECLQEALEDVYRVSFEDTAADNFRGGATDVQKSYSLLRQAGVSEEGIAHHQQAFMDYAGELYRLRADEDTGEAAAGAADFLASCRAHGYRLGIVSLELEPIARLKLAIAGLALADEPGAFAGDVKYHTGLVPLARKRVGEAVGQKTWPRHRTVVVGAGSGAICRGHSDPCAVALLRSRHEQRQIGNAEWVGYGFQELEAYLAGGPAKVSAAGTW